MDEMLNQKKELNPFSQERLNLNKETDLAEGERQYSSSQHGRLQRDLNANSDELTNALKEENNIQELDFKERRQMHEQLFANKIGALDHDYKWYKRADSPRMKTVKKKLREIINVMNMPIEKTKGKVDPLFVRDNVLAKYNDALVACDDYLQNTPAKHSTGRRRFKMVDEIKGMIQDEILTLNVVIDAAANGVFDNKENIKTIGDLYWNVPSEPVTQAVWQKEGNSTDVYLVDLAPDQEGKVKQYYVKENLKLISDDLPGYLNRRIRQVKSSQQAFLQGNENRQEERLKEGRLKEEDYAKGLKVLQLIQKKINDAEGKEKLAVQKRMLEFLGHDFDKFFADYENHNANIEMIEDQRESAAEFLAKLTVDEDTRRKNITIVLALEALLKDNKPLRKLTPYEYLKFRITTSKDFKGLDIKKDSDILKVLSQMYSEDNEKGMQKFFTRTLGKEAEQYGQHVERGGGTSENEILNSNNIVTGRMGAKFGFKEEVAGATLRVMKFQLNGEEKATDVNCTVIDPAEGTEMLDIVKMSEEQNIPITYSPNAMRQLVRLQMFDTVCLQTDRHWRNFKCVHETVTDNNGNRSIVIKSMKSYDHDRSFAPTSLKDAFKDKTTNKSKNKIGMLPNLMSHINTNSPEYAYLTQKGMAKTGTNFLRYVENPYEEFKNIPTQEIYGCSNAVASLRIGLYGSSSTFLARYDTGDKKEIFGERRLDEMSEKETKEIDDYLEDGNGIYNDHVMKMVGSLRTKNGSLIKGAPVPNKEGKYDPLDRLRLTEPQKNLANALVLLKNLTIFAKDDMSTNGCYVELKMVDELKNGDRRVFNKDKTVNEYAKLITKKDLGDIMEALKCISETLRDYTLADKAMDFHLKFILFYFKNCYQNSPEAKEAYVEAEKEKDPQYVDEQEIEVPSMLHMDEEAYNNLVEMNNNHELIDFTIKDQNWSEEKIQAFKDRIKETVEEIDRMKIKAEKYLEKMYEKGDVRRNFFLKAEDYDKIEDIKEIAWNPSLSYFGIEDPNYLYGDKDFTSNVAISPEEAKRAMSETNELRNIQRQRLGNMTGKYHSIVSSKVTKVS